MTSSEPSRARLVLGTAQLGMPYGAANTSGRPPEDEARRILDLAAQRDVRTLDTAQDYGDSESQIGRWLGGSDALQVVTKLAPHLDAGDPDVVVDAVRASRRRIGPALAGVLLHDPTRLGAWPPSVRACMADGLVRFGGVSVYEPDEFARALEFDELMAIQAPFSVADRRLMGRGLLAAARERGVRVFLRSAFLQGVLLLEPAAVPERLGFLRAPLARWRMECERLGLLPLAAALGWVKAQAAGAEIVVGAETAEQLAETLDAWEAVSLDEATCHSLAEAIGAVPQEQVDPRRWPTP